MIMKIVINILVHDIMPFLLLNSAVRDINKNINKYLKWRKIIINLNEFSMYDKLIEIICNRYFK